MHYVIQIKSTENNSLRKRYVMYFRQLNCSISCTYSVFHPLVITTIATGGENFITIK